MFLLLVVNKFIVLAGNILTFLLIVSAENMFTFLFIVSTGNMFSFLLIILVGNMSILPGTFELFKTVFI